MCKDKLVKLTTSVTFLPDLKKVGISGLAYIGREFSGKTIIGAVFDNG